MGLLQQLVHLIVVVLLLVVVHLVITFLQCHLLINVQYVAVLI